MILVGALFMFQFLPAEEIKTPGEISRYTKYSQHEEITVFLSELDHQSEELKVKIIGHTKETREYESRDIYLCIINREKSFRPDELNRKKPTFFFIASQHGNEQSAKEATLRMIRDLAVGELNLLLDKVNFLVIPQANPYGNFFDQRHNEQDLDLNRDHVKLEAPESRAIHWVFSHWMPEVTIDVHEKGDDYYRVSIGCVSNANISMELQDFSRKVLLGSVDNELKKHKISFHEYLITQPMGIDSSAGVTYTSRETEGRPMMKRYSTSDLNDGRNSLGIYETISFIQEGASRHDLETLEERTRWQYLGIRYVSEAVAKNGEKILSLVDECRRELLERADVFSEDDRVHIRMKYARNPQDPELTINQFQRSPSPIRGVLKVDKKAGEPLMRQDIGPYPYPSEYRVETVTEKNWFPLVEPTLSVSRPLGYIIPSCRKDVVDTLLHHVLRVEIFSHDKEIDVEVYTVGEIEPADYDYLPPKKIMVEKNSRTVVVNKGDFYIPCDQPGANLIVCLLEPQSLYGLIRYWDYELLPEQAGLFPFFRVVRPAEFPTVPYKNWH
ncbi:MAG: DUF2817 domain-containing protein [Candidatus Aminicenantes bacterium]|nr:DUF2817 domain-containing protein [Candidatus Aminicenantes bacterium]